MIQDNNEDFFSETAVGIIVNVKVIPNSSKSAIGDIQGDCLRIKIASAPERGRANKECQRFLAGFFNVRRSQVVLQQGESSRRKRILIEGITKDVLMRKLFV